VVLTLGIAGLCLACIWPAGWILGGIAVGIGSGDLRQMRQGRMDPSGRSTTEAGRVCGWIAIAVASLCFLLFCLIQMDGGGF
jgi:hypothetical protein